MSDDKGFVAPVNVVKPTSNQPSDVQDLQDANNLMSTNLMCLPPDAPPALIAALWKEIEPLDLFTKPFGIVNEYGETILFELPVKVCAVYYSDKGNIKVSSENVGKVAIIFHLDKSKVFMIVKRSDKLWPCETEELLKNTKFHSDGCAIERDISGNQYLSREPIIHNSDAGYMFIISDEGIKFSNEQELIQFKTVIRNVQSRMSMNRLPMNDLPKKGSARVISEFWFQSALRPCSVKLLYFHEALIWTKIQISNPATPEPGIVALAQSKVDKTLQLISVSKKAKTNVQVSGAFTLIPSDISPDPKNVVWEWFVDYQSRDACGFKSVKEASNFEVVIDYYVDAWKKKSLSWDW